MTERKQLKPSYVLDAWMVAREEYLTAHGNSSRAKGELDLTDEEHQQLDDLLEDWEVWSVKLDRCFAGLPVYDYPADKPFVETVVIHPKSIHDLPPKVREGTERSPYPEMCREPKLCAGKGYCPRDPACNE